MTSHDIYAIAQDEQAFRVYVITKLDNHEVRLSRLEEQQAETRAEVRAIREEQRLILHDLNNIQTSVYWVLGAIGIFLAGLGVVIAGLQLFPRRESEAPQPEPQIPPTPPSETVRLINAVLDTRERKVTQS